MILIGEMTFGGEETVGGEINFGGEKTVESKTVYNTKIAKSHSNSHIFLDTRIFPCNNNILKIQLGRFPNSFARVNVL
jgi:hypothetical protein